MCPNRGDRDLEQFGGHGTDTFLRHDYATNKLYCDAIEMQFINPESESSSVPWSVTNKDNKEEEKLSGEQNNSSSQSNTETTANIQE